MEMKSEKEIQPAVLGNCVSLEIQSGHADFTRLGQGGHANNREKIEEIWGNDPSFSSVF